MKLQNSVSSSGSTSKSRLFAIYTTSEDEKKDQVSPQDEKALEEAAAQYHSDEDWPLLAKKILLKV